MLYDDSRLQLQPIVRYDFPVQYNPEARFEPPPHPAVDQALRTDRQPAFAAQPRSPIDQVIASYLGRDLDAFFMPGSVEQAAERLQFAKDVVIMTGFNVSAGMPETDGPIGAAILADALQRLGVNVTCVTDTDNGRVTEAAFDVLNRHRDPDVPGRVTFRTFDVDRHDPTVQDQAVALLDELDPQVVVGVELPSRTEVGDPSNMRGVNIGAFNAGLDEIMLMASKMGIHTIGVGDGGNEAGMGGLEGVPNAANGQPMQAAIPADVAVTAWNSNLGAEAIAAVLLQLAGRLEEMPSPADLKQMIRAAFKAGAYDGVTRLNVPGKTDRNGYVTGVDGFGIDVHVEMLERLRHAASTIEIRQFLLGVGDSGNGGAIAANTLLRELQKIFPYPVRVVACLDHGIDSYGGKPALVIATRTGDFLMTLDKIKPDVDIVLCNTASGYLKLVDDQFDVKTPVENLVFNTVPVIVKLGGERPAILATQAMVDNQECNYQTLARQASGGQVRPVGIAAPGWAEHVNALDQRSLDPLTQIALQHDVDRVVDQIPEDATSVVLCCTHYRELSEHIRAALKARGREGLQIIDPVEHLAPVIANAMMRADLDKQTHRVRAPQPVVLTSAQDDQTYDRVKKSIQLLMPDAQKEGEAFVLQLFHGFNTQHDLKIAGELLLRPSGWSAYGISQAQLSDGGPMMRQRAPHPEPLPGAGPEPDEPASRQTRPSEENDTIGLGRSLSFDDEEERRRRGR